MPPFLQLRSWALLMIGLLPASVWAQTRSVTLPSRKVTVEQAIGQISSQTGLIVGVNHKTFDVTRTIVASSEVQPVYALLDKIVEGTGHTYMTTGTHVMIVTDRKTAAAAAAQSVLVPAKKPRPARAADPEIEPAPVRETADSIPVTSEIREYYAVSKTVTENRFSFSVYDPSTFEQTDAKQPRFAVKTNLLHGIATLTPNLGVEFGIGRKTTLEITGGYNPWNRKGSYGDNKKHVHTYIQPEFRWWTCERFNGHFFGVHAIGANYNIAEHRLSLLGFEKEYRYEGFAFGGGVSYGYGMMLSRVIGLEFTVGVGVVRLAYDRYDCGLCLRDKERFTDVRFIPTKAAVSVVFIIK